VGGQGVQLPSHVLAEYVEATWVTTIAFFGCRSKFCFMILSGHFMSLKSSQIPLFWPWFGYNWRVLLSLAIKRSRLQFTGTLHNGAITLMKSHCDFTWFFIVQFGCHFLFVLFFSPEIFCLKSSEQPTIYKAESLKAKFSFSYNRCQI
jgi:hypothetical protein